MATDVAPSSPRTAIPGGAHALEAGFLQRNLDIAKVDDMGVPLFPASLVASSPPSGRSLCLSTTGRTSGELSRASGVLTAEQSSVGAFPSGGSRTDSGIVMAKTDETFVKVWQSKIRFKDIGIDGGLGALLRRVFTSPIMFPPGLVEKLGIQHVKGARSPILQCSTADPHGAYGKASPKATHIALSLTVLMSPHTQTQGRRLLVIATTSLRSMLTDLSLTSFDTELQVAPITDSTALDRVLEAVELFRSTRDRAHAVDMLRQAGLGTNDGRLIIDIKCLLSVIEMATGSQGCRGAPGELVDSLRGCEDMARSDGIMYVYV
ncbi:hypothetical protein H4582DRAFT_2084374 [Lactarius indigo]|nr:hypothetical protein H4582DRAFT_2084374 [Lactarius indigo]